MPDNTNMVPVIADLLKKESVIKSKTDGQIIAGLRGGNADQYLQAANKTCIGISEVSELATGTPGCRAHGRIDFDSDYQVDVMSRLSEAYAMEISKLCRDLFVGDIETVFGGENYQLRVMSVSRRSWLEQPDIFHDTITIRGKGFYWKL